MIVFMLNATNNKVEYEVVIINLRLAKGLDIKSRSVKFDSQLVVNQVKGDYAKNKEKLMKCLNITQDSNIPKTSQS